ncbi:nicotinate phosphoribosyltransferase [Umezakia ovalisporum]|uniref:Nicotinate phosphoribosyltransferase n=1 Tax=Umezakia ovalisporum FSS-62 TaxID=2971776 RepID=A0AA43KFF3_9CYAN|nr:nicotinate phosphoribosyltransferase [Umezakia ovalisporum]MDH6063808.1 nicotinate phosphoribosyltransferase [Umezakia ovalisporum FSS-62]MDH6077842.1 nicotinate phosphoribosyltransferase [Umezakia ovalisporum FSS-45]MDH6102685.1 nicotinate phosphoribosyltransferase [Umezakia ovalisporum ANA283AFssAo]
MAITKVLAEMTKSISEGLQIVVTDVMRIFSPSDDEYPMIGVQPFSGEIYRKIG